jgi:hypothetical protein
VAAALAGSLVTLLLDHGAARSATQPFAIRNTGNTAPAPRRVAICRVAICRVAICRVAIGRVAIGRPGRPVRVEIGGRPACSVIRLPHRAKLHDHG